MYLNKYKIDNTWSLQQNYVFIEANRSFKTLKKCSKQCFSFSFKLDHFKLPKRFILNCKHEAYKHGTFIKSLPNTKEHI